MGMSNTLTLRRFWDVCCTAVANPQDKGVGVEERVVKVKMDENLSKDHKKKQPKTTGDMRKTNCDTTIASVGFKKKREWIQRG